MINITFYFYRFLDSLRSLEMTEGTARNSSRDNSMGYQYPVISTLVEKSNK